VQVLIFGVHFPEGSLLKVLALPHSLRFRFRLTLSQRSLETFYGIGPNVSQRIMARFHIQPWAKVGTLKNSTVLDLTTELSEMKIENDLRREVQENIKRLKDMGTYRGRRHAMGLPVRGQRTRTQVRRLLMETWYWKLIVIDCNGKAVEQGGTRWRWTNTDLKGDFAYNCIILYIKHNARDICGTSWRKSCQKRNTIIQESPSRSSTYMVITSALPDHTNVGLTCTSWQITPVYLSATLPERKTTSDILAAYCRWAVNRSAILGTETTTMALEKEYAVTALTLSLCGKEHELLLAMVG